MTNEAARWMLKEIDERIRTRKRALPLEISKPLGYLRKNIDAGHQLFKDESDFLTKLHERLTEPRRIKW